jgi:hypothetical protein
MKQVSRRTSSVRRTAPWVRISIPTRPRCVARATPGGAAARRLFAIQFGALPAGTFVHLTR